MFALRPSTGIVWTFYVNLVDIWGDPVSPRSVGRECLARGLDAVAAVVALALGGVCMWKVHEFSAPGPVITVLARKHLRVQSQTGHV